MKRTEIERTIEPMIRECLRKFGDFSPPDISPEEFAKVTAGELRADVRRVSLLLSLAQAEVGAQLEGEGLELGCGYGYLLFPLAIYFPKVHWTGVEHPDRKYFRNARFQEDFRIRNCNLVGLDLMRQPLPFTDHHFCMVTFSETLEHLPVERVNFVMDEICRVLRPGGFLLLSSPNQASLENRIRLLKGKSILDLPDHMEAAKGTFGHIRLYTPAEVVASMTKRGLELKRSVLESNNSTYRGGSSRSLRRSLYRCYERAEQHLGFLRGLGDTWYMVFRKSGGEPEAEMARGKTRG